MLSQQRTKVDLYTVKRDEKPEQHLASVQPIFNFICYTYIYTKSTEFTSVAGNEGLWHAGSVYVVYETVETCWIRDHCVRKSDSGGDAL